jgi:hypothetical protein
MIGHATRLLGLLILLLADAHAADRVQLESARYQVGPLQLRLARERGETVARLPIERGCDRARHRGGKAVPRRATGALSGSGAINSCGAALRATGASPI